MRADDTISVTIDPIGSATPAEFSRGLKALMRVRRRSVDSLVRRSRDAGTPIARATIYNLLSGTGAPRRDSVVAFLRGCGVPPREQIRWLIAFDQVYRPGQGPSRPQAGAVAPRRAWGSAA